MDRGAGSDENGRNGSHAYEKPARWGHATLKRWKGAKVPTDGQSVRSITTRRLKSSLPTESVVEIVVLAVDVDDLEGGKFTFCHPVGRSVHHAHLG
jgi:hypothetical protein